VFGFDAVTRSAIAVANSRPRAVAMPAPRESSDACFDLSSTPLTGCPRGSQPRQCKLTRESTRILNSTQLLACRIGAVINWLPTPMRVATPLRGLRILLHTCNALSLCLWVNQPSREDVQRQEGQRYRQILENARLGRDDSYYLPSVKSTNDKLSVLWIETDFTLPLPLAALLSLRYYQRILLGTAGVGAIEYAFFQLLSWRRPRVGCVGSVRDVQILYLRPFHTDDLPPEMKATAAGPFQILMPDGVPSDYELCSYYRSAGQVTALVKAGGRAPTGPDRLVRASSADEWKALARDLINRATLILLVVGEGRNVAWELETVLQSGAGSKLILLYPARGYGAVLDALRRYEYTAPVVLEAGTAAITLGPDRVARLYAGFPLSAG
jgi:hypothetical protein